LHVTNGPYGRAVLQGKIASLAAYVDPVDGQERRRSVAKTAGNATRGWFGLSRGQFFWFVAIRVIVAAIVGAVVYVVTGSVLWLIVALVATGAVINGVANTQHRR
jgi:hypothetical protein